ncbi:MAG: hypothetical protein ACKO4R_15360, partial [Synechococcales cyanobacterium]
WKIDIKDSAKYDHEAENLKIQAILENRHSVQSAPLEPEDDWEEPEPHFEDEDAVPLDTPEQDSSLNPDDGHTDYLTQLPEESSG